MLPHKVLYIEDDDNDFKRMQKEIDNKKFEIIEETYGDKAIGKVKEDKHKIIKAILLDIVLKDPKTNLSQRFQGDEVAHRIKEIRPEIPIIAVSWQGRINAAINGYYPKETLFKVKGMFKGLEEALEDAIQQVEVTAFYPQDGGGKQWRDRWGREYIEFRNNTGFSNKIVEIEKAARQDYDLLNNGKIGETYRKYRGTDSLYNILIARRVIFAAAFASSISEKGTINNIVWDEVCTFLGFDEYDMEGLKNFMHACGIKWGGILNKTTLLKEEEEWLKREHFLNY